MYYLCIHFEKKSTKIFKIDWLKIKQVNEKDFFKKLNNNVYLIFLEILN